AAARAEYHRVPKPFDVFLGRFGMTPDLDALHPFGHLLTPAFAPVRFDTQFFIAPVPPNQEPHVERGELVRGQWITPAEALARWERNAMKVPPPTLAMLKALARFGPQEAAQILNATDGKPHHERFRIEVHPGIYVEPLPTRTLPPATTTNCYFVVGQKDVVIIDPAAETQEGIAVLDYHLAGLAKEGKKVTAILLTHHHSDHVGAVRWLKDRTGAPVMAHSETAERLPKGLVDDWMEDGDTVKLGKYGPTGAAWTLKAIHTPGHAPGHLAFLDSRWNAVIGGDLVSAVSTILIDPDDDGDMGAYLDSLERILELDPPILLPSHGAAITDPVGKLEEYREHRLMREGKVLHAVQSGHRTVDAMLPVAYDDTDPSLYGLALQSLRAHLAKLEDEGRVAQKNGTYEFLG
ncbi:MAG TPA: MBL fold metallo-hydrolase, partial [Candidatus Thermoplasmatota archaeon]|nr:MBL fold metallo-hydrolase [Candidatus Thermoplasmatota archaeon]